MTDNTTTTDTNAIPDPRKESLIEYPSQFPIKVMGAKVDGFVHAVTQIAEQHKCVALTRLEDRCERERLVGGRPDRKSVV